MLDLFVISGIILVIKNVVTFKADEISSWFLVFWNLFVNISPIFLKFNSLNFGLLYDVPSNFHISVAHESVIESLKILTIINLIFSVSKFRVTRTVMFQPKPSSSFDYKFGVFLFFTGSLFSSLDGMFKYFFASATSYSSVYAGDYISPVPFMFVWNILLNFGVFLVLKNSGGKNLRWFLFLLIISGAINALYGQRSAIIIPIAFAIFVSAMRSSARSTVKYLVPILILCVFAIFETVTTGLEYEITIPVPSPL